MYLEIKGNLSARQPFDQVTFPQWARAVQLMRVYPGYQLQQQFGGTRLGQGHKVDVIVQVKVRVFLPTGQVESAGQLVIERWCGYRRVIQPIHIFTPEILAIPFRQIKHPQSCDMCQVGRRLRLQECPINGAKSDFHLKLFNIRTLFQFPPEDFPD